MKRNIFYLIIGTAMLLLCACGGSTVQIEAAELAVEESKDEEIFVAVIEDATDEEASAEVEEEANDISSDEFLAQPDDIDQATIDCNLYSLNILEIIAGDFFDSPIPLGNDVDCIFQSNNGIFMLATAGNLMSAEEIEEQYSYTLIEEDDGLQLVVVIAPSGTSLTAFGRSASGHVLVFSAAGNPAGEDPDLYREILESLVRETARQTNIILSQ